MTVVEVAREAMNQESLKLPPKLPIVRWSVEDYEDSSGEQALRVLVVLDENVDIEKISGRDVGELKFAIYDALQRKGITLFPYVFLAKQSELDEPTEE
jgi:hypothetical protein